MKWIVLIIFSWIGTQWLDSIADQPIDNTNSIQLHILGIAQDAGSPHIACRKSCCAEKFSGKKKPEKVVCLGLLDYSEKKYWIFEATPDMAQQLWTMQQAFNPTNISAPTGIFISHAHIGHYTGLMYLGKEGMNASYIPVFVMPRFKKYLSENGPWSQLVTQNNITLVEMQAGAELHLNDRIRVRPIRVPHRDEFSETVGFIIIGPNKKILFIPDIDKWEKWENNLSQLLHAMDYVFIDGTFYQESELPGRKISEIPHPFIPETMSLLQTESETTKKKVYFIHLNHTNPAIDPKSKESKWIISQGFHVAREGMIFNL